MGGRSGRWEQKTSDGSHWSVWIPPAVLGRGAWDLELPRSRRERRRSVSGWAEGRGSCWETPLQPAGKDRGIPKGEHPNAGLETLPPAVQGSSCVGFQLCRVPAVWGCGVPAVWGSSCARFQLCKVPAVRGSGCVGFQLCRVPAVWGSSCLGFQLCGITAVWGSSYAGFQLFGVLAVWGSSCVGIQL